MKRLLHFAISLCWFLRQSLSRWAAGLAGRKAPATFVVLYYHAIRADQKNRFSRQMDILCRLTAPARADSSRPFPAGGRHSAVTFDDGFRSVKDNALPELKKRQIPCTIFVACGFLGQEPEWASREFAAVVCGDVIMTAEELRNIASGLVTIGSHTMTHPRLTAIPESSMAREVLESRSTLESLLEMPIKMFSFPYGDFDDRAAACCRKAGYERVFTSLPYNADPTEFLIGRVSADPDDWSLEFRLKLLGAYNWLPGAIRLKRKLREQLERRVSRHLAFALTATHSGQEGSTSGLRHPR